MKPVLIAAIIIVHLALLFYSLFIYQEHKKRSAHNLVWRFLALGLLFDVISTTCMIMGSTQSPFTVHGILGYTSLSGMIFDGILIWRHRVKKGSKESFPRWLNIYSKCAYIWWVLAYITGAVIVAIK